MSNEKVNGALAKGQEFYNKGNELMDKVPVLKNPLYKKIVWGILCLVLLLAVGRIFGCGGAQAPFDVFKEMMVAMTEGDIETMFSHIYIPQQERERLAKLSYAEAELIEKEIVNGFVNSFGDMSEEQLSIMKATIGTMRLKDVKKDGDKAILTYVMTVGGEDREEDVTLRLVDGEWKVDLGGM